MFDDRVGQRPRRSCADTATNIGFTTVTNNALDLSANNTVITLAGGTGLASFYYWSCSEATGVNSWGYYSYAGNISNFKKNNPTTTEYSNVYRVRAAFAF